MDAAITRHNAVRQLFRDRHGEPRTGNDVLIFHGWLQENRPDLLPPVKGAADTYQHLKSELRDLWKDD